MNVRDLWYKFQLKINLQFIKNSWIDLKRNKAKAFFGIGGIAISIILLTAIGMVNDTMSYNYIDSVTNTTGSADIMITKIPQTDIPMILILMNLLFKMNFLTSLELTNFFQELCH